LRAAAGASGRDPLHPPRRRPPRSRAVAIRRFGMGERALLGSVHGGDQGLVALLVFKTSGPPTAGGGFDSHPPPPRRARGSPTTPGGGDVHDVLRSSPPPAAGLAAHAASALTCARGRFRDPRR